MKPTEDEIRNRAYWNFRARAGSEGCPEEDWSLAEEQLEQANAQRRADPSRLFPLTSLSLKQDHRFHTTLTTCEPNGK